jgi:hypothetical protein
MFNRTQGDIDRIVQSFCDELDDSANEIRQSSLATKSADFAPAAAQLKTFNEAIWKITASLVLTAPSGKPSLSTAKFAAEMLFTVTLLALAYLNDKQIKLLQPSQVMPQLGAFCQLVISLKKKYIIRMGCCLVTLLWEKTKSDYGM